MGDLGDDMKMYKDLYLEADLCQGIEKILGKGNLSRFVNNAMREFLAKSPGSQATYFEELQREVQTLLTEADGKKQKLSELEQLHEAERLKKEAQDRVVQAAKTVKTELACCWSTDQPLYNDCFKILKERTLAMSNGRARFIPSENLDHAKKLIEFWKQKRGEKLEG